MKSRIGRLALVVLCLKLGVADAQYSDPNAPPPPPGQAQPAPPPTAVAPPPPPPPAQPTTTVIYTTAPQGRVTTTYARPEPRAEISGFIGVPVFVSDRQDVAGAGVGLSGRYGWKLNELLVLEFGGGWQINWLDLSLYGGYDRVSFNLFYFNLGLRVYIPTESTVRPFFSAHLDFDFWHLEGDVGYTCGGYYYWWCYEYNQYYYEPGVSGRVGAQIKLGGSAALEVGLRIGTSFGTEFFDQPETWLDPFLGFTAFM